VIGIWAVLDDHFSPDGIFITVVTVGSVNQINQGVKYASRGGHGRWKRDPVLAGKPKACAQATAILVG
jgi:hypothetical protein